MCHLRPTSQTTKAIRGQNVFKATSCVKVRAATLSDTGRPFLEKKGFLKKLWSKSGTIDIWHNRYLAQ